MEGLSRPDYGFRGLAESLLGHSSWAAVVQARAGAGDERTGAVRRKWGGLRLAAFGGGDGAFRRWEQWDRGSERATWEEQLELGLGDICWKREGLTVFRERWLVIPSNMRIVPSQTSSVGQPGQTGTNDLTKGSRLWWILGSGKGSRAAAVGRGNRRQSGASGSGRVDFRDRAGGSSGHEQRKKTSWRLQLPKRFSPRFIDRENLK